MPIKSSHTHDGALRDGEAGVVDKQAVAVALGQASHLHHLVSETRPHWDLDAVDGGVGAIEGLGLRTSRSVPWVANSELKSIGLMCHMPMCKTAVTPTH